MEQQTGGPGPGSPDPAFPLRSAEAAYGPVGRTEAEAEHTPGETVPDADETARGAEEPAREGAWDTQTAGEAGREPAREGAWDTAETAAGAQPGAADELPDEPGEQRPATGEPRVDAALARLDELAGRPVTEHRAIFEDVHRRLRDVLGELDTREPPQPRDAMGAERREGR